MTEQVSPTAAGLPPDARDVRPTLVGQWGWFIAKNILGWLLILAAFVVGPLVPGPGGIPLFLIGFALVTFPGKRRLTARVLRGRPLDARTPAYRRGAAVVAILLPAAALVYLAVGWHLFPRPTLRTSGLVGAAYVGGALLTWFVSLYAVGLFNWALRLAPRIRRKSRPWLRHHGIDLLPPRRRRRHHADGSAAPRAEPNDEILEIREAHRTRLRSFWTRLRPWLRRSIGIGITVAIFWWILRPIVRHWDQVGTRVMGTNWWRVLGASVMFAGFLFVFRVLAWRRIIKDLGRPIPVAPATRIWSTSELARYLPGVIWQVVGRAYLCKPYGVSGRICSTSQVLELAIFLLANLIMAVSCLAFLARHVHGVARGWLIAAAALVPILVIVLHPRVFYGAVNRILARLNKTPLERTLSFKRLVGLLGWSLLGLAWQGLSIWVVVYYLLELPLAKWWVVTGAYCLAWCAGFLAFWAPGGLGVREAVFIAAMEFALPVAVLHGPLATAGDKYLFLIFLSVLLRIWATVGELILAGLAYLFDLRGALGLQGTEGFRRPHVSAEGPTSDLEPRPANPRFGETKPT
jgi:glycosyltransferase 2 family protein